MTHNLGIVIGDHGGGAHEAEEKDAAHKEAGIEVIGQVIKGAGGQIALGHKTTPGFRVAGHHPGGGVHIDEYNHGNGLAVRHLALHGSSDHIEAIVGYESVRGAGSNARIGANNSKDLAAQMTQGVTLVKAVVDKDRSLDHHHEVAEGQIDNQYIRGSAQRFGCREDPDNQSIAQHRQHCEEDIERSQQIVHRLGRLRIREPVLGDVTQLLRRNIPAQQTRFGGQPRLRPQRGGHVAKQETRRHVSGLHAPVFGPRRNHSQRGLRLLWGPSELD